jgi:hypothetical protein
MTKNWWRWALAPIVVVFISYPAAWLMARNSDAYVASESFLRSSPQVIDVLGSVSAVTLSPFGYSVRYVGARGDASFELSVQGTKETAKVFIELQKLGVWEVRLLRLVRAGQPVMDIPLSQR